MPIRALLLDCFGVLVQTAESSVQHRLEEQGGWQKGTIDKLGMTLLNSHYFQSATIGDVSAELIWKDVSVQLYGCATHWKDVQELYLAAHQRNDELLAYIQELRKLCKVGILSNAFSDARTFIAGRLGLAEMVDDILISAEEGIAKPARSLYRKAAERLQVVPSEILYLDDTLLYTRLLKSIGMSTICFQNNTQALAEIQHYFRVSERTEA
ncbi:HAD family hydrolase [Tengunoibacter tsumagoiensis]|uniref:Haloacid dehalogenase n=1 Tax=Tengunoibacter tsumagoiensis TaxID=2014871 RepID=A0A402A731_9CHLR|nr:HAD family hydrolase [Tengunoibacter tsumagoiensis]GCE14944.1 hypothetical protein KTT_48030 [Tengunoibacter tsumagoiensis]